MKYWIPDNLFQWILHFYGTIQHKTVHFPSITEQGSTIASQNHFFPLLCAEIAALEWCAVKSETDQVALCHLKLPSASIYLHLYRPCTPSLNLILLAFIFIYKWGTQPWTNWDCVLMNAHLRRRFDATFPKLQLLVNLEGKIKSTQSLSTAHEEHTRG